MRTEFEQVVRQIVDESLDRDSGLNISPETMQAYQKLLAIYDNAIDPALKALSSKDRFATQYCMSFITDCMRTIVMLRASNRAILARRRSGAKDVHVIEAGMGSGLLLAAVMALDANVTCTGYDKMPGNHAVTARLLAELRYSERAKLHRLDLLELTYRPKADVLIAEHINQGLTAEHATKIPRLFDVDPHYVIPYAVTPSVYWNGIRRTDRGNQIVLADRSATEYFVVKGTLKLPPLAVQPIATSCDIEWGSPQLGSSSLLQRSSNCLKGSGWENHLIQALWLPQHSLNGDSICAIQNTSAIPQVASYDIAYPIGTFADKHPTLPIVKANGHGVSSTVLFRGRAQLTESLKSARHRWWKVFA
jgi:hypothetical protein